MSKASVANKVYNFRRYDEPKLVRAIDRRTRAGENIIDNGDVPQHITDQEGNRIWSFR